MNTARIAELLEPFLVPPIVIQDDSSIAEGSILHSEALRTRRGSAVLSPSQLQHISTYIDILCRWNARINLTAIRDPEEIVTRHFGESLFAARHLFPDGQATCEGAPDASAIRGRAALQGRVAGQGESRAFAPVAIRVADIGSGAGFPGLPIKLWAPQLSLTLIEANHKKATFLREITRAITLTDVNIQNARAESLGPSAFDVVTLRAVERFETILPIAAALVASGGRLALLIGSAQQDQARTTLPRFMWSHPVPIPASRTRILLISRRVTTNQDS